MNKEFKSFNSLSEITSATLRSTAGFRRELNFLKDFYKTKYDQENYK